MDITTPPLDSSYDRGRGMGREHPRPPPLPDPPRVGGGRSFTALYSPLLPIPNFKEPKFFCEKWRVVLEFASWLTLSKPRSLIGTRRRVGPPPHRRSKHLVVPLAQRIEHKPPELGMGVRFPQGAFFYSCLAGIKEVWRGNGLFHERTRNETNHKLEPDLPPKKRSHSFRFVLRHLESNTKHIFERDPFYLCKSKVEQKQEIEPDPPQ